MSCDCDACLLAKYETLDALDIEEARELEELYREEEAVARWDAEHAYDGIV